MNIYLNFLENKWIIRIMWSIISIVISIVVYNIIVNLVSSKADKSHIKFLSTKKGKTYFKMLRSIIRYIIIIINCLIIFKIFGINITSMLAGVGIIGIVFGFAVQDALKDIIKGVDIITDNYYQVGDVIKYGNIVGKVLTIGLKTTKVEDIYSFNIISISNRNIDLVEVVSNLINIDIPIPYEVEVHDAEKAVLYIVDEIKKHKDVINCEYRGINDLADSAIKYQIKVYCNPVLKVQIRRDSLRYIILGLKKYNISVPYNQIDIHQK